MNEQTFYSLTYGLFVLTVNHNGFDNGCIINTAIQAALTPCTITISVSKENYTAELIKESGVFNVSVLAENAPFSLFERFGFQSGRTAQKFDGFAYSKRAGNGVLYINEFTNAYFCCSVKQTVDLGSHYLFIANVDDCDSVSALPSMTYSYYFSNVKPKPQAVESAGKVWVCKICGYIYDEAAEGTAFEALPDDWVCPLCKHPKSDFELQS